MVAQNGLAVGIRHIAMMVKSVGPDAAAREMRKHVAWYVKGLPHSAAVREQVNTTRSVDEMAALLRTYLEELRAHPSPGGDAGPDAAPVRPEEEGVAAF